MDSSSRVSIDYHTKILAGGTSNRLYKNLAAGQKTIRIDMQWAAGNTRRNLVIKTFAKTDVPFTFNSVPA